MLSINTNYTILTQQVLLCLKDYEIIAFTEVSSLCDFCVFTTLKHSDTFSAFDFEFYHLHLLNPPAKKRFSNSTIIPVDVFI